MTDEKKATSLSIVVRGMFSALGIVVLAVSTTNTARAQQRIAIEERFADVNGIKLHYQFAGKGDPVILLHGYTQTSHMWRPHFPITR